MSKSPNQPTIIINIGIQFDGYVFQLQPKSKKWLKENYPDVQTVSSIFIGFEKMKDAEQIHGKIWEQISMLLTGLSIEQLNKLGGFSVYSPSSRKEVINSLELVVNS